MPSLLLLVVRAAGITALMAAFWIFEVVPLAITALMPLVLFPLLDVAPGSAMAAQYFNRIVRKDTSLQSP